MLFFNVKKLLTTFSLESFIAHMLQSKDLKFGRRMALISGMPFCYPREYLLNFGEVIMLQKYQFAYAQ